MTRKNSHPCLPNKRKLAAAESKRNDADGTISQSSITTGCSSSHLPMSIITPHPPYYATGPEKGRRTEYHRFIHINNPPFNNYDTTTPCASSAAAAVVVQAASSLEGKEPGGKKSGITLPIRLNDLVAIHSNESTPPAANIRRGRRGGERVTVTVKNVASSITEKILKDKFSAAGTVLRARISMDVVGGKGKRQRCSAAAGSDGRGAGKEGGGVSGSASGHGVVVGVERYMTSIGFVTFPDSVQANRAVRTFNGKRLGSRHIIVDLHPSQRKKNRWFPFIVPWSIAQVVNIWQVSDCDNKEKTEDGEKDQERGVKERDAGEFRLEVRWVYRPGDLAGRRVTHDSSAIAALRLCKDEASGRGVEQVFESNLHSEIEVSSLLGPVVMVPMAGGKDNKGGEGNECPEVLGQYHVNAGGIFPEVKCTCRFFYDTKRKTLRSTEERFPGKSWSERGRHTSPTLQKNRKMRAALELAEENALVSGSDSGGVVVDSVVGEPGDDDAAAPKKELPTTRDENENVRDGVKGKVSSPSRLYDLWSDPRSSPNGGGEEDRDDGRPNRDRADIQEKFAEALANDHCGCEGAIADESGDRDATIQNLIRIATVDPPVHVDVSSQKAYYLSAKVTPPYTKFLSLSSSSEASELEQRNERKWIVTVGDTVLVHSEASAHHQPLLAGADEGGNNGPPHHPFGVPWDVAEVLSIWKKFPRNEVKALRRTLTGQDFADDNDDDADSEKGQQDGSGNAYFQGCCADDANGVMLEVRWFYGKDEVTVSHASCSQEEVVSVATGTGGLLQEVFETDHVGTLDASYLLGPVVLSSVQNTGRTTIAESFSEDEDVCPLLEFFCRRFWSVRRRKCVPCGSSAQRSTRGRLHSREMAKNVALLKAVERALASKEGLDRASHGKGLSGDDLILLGVEPWAAAMSSTSNVGSGCDQKCSDLPSSEDPKLLLIAAASAFSVSAASSFAVEEGGAGRPLVGREDEQRRIVNFLRTAIRSRSHVKERGAKSSIVLLGPAGSGKTASVKSALAFLREEQQKGLLPPFRFASVNGAKIKDPFDAYVTLWEKIRCDNHKPSTGAAVALLESHFGSGSCCGDRSADDGGDSMTDSGRGVIDGMDDRKVDNGQGQRFKKGIVTVVLLDNMDRLITQKQTVLSNFFDWSGREGRNTLVVVAVSKAIDLAEKLNPSLRSWVSAADKCMFRSYDVSDIAGILKQRLALGSIGRPCDGSFDADAIAFAARISACDFSGDMRKAFQLCRKAAKYAFDEVESGTRSARGSMVQSSDVEMVARSMRAE